MKMKYLSDDHYIVMDDSEIKDGDFVYSSDGGIFKRHIDNPCQAVFRISKVTHSTKPLESDIHLSYYFYNNIKPISISEVKELLGVVDVHTKAMSKYSLGEINNEHDFTLGYKQALEDNKEKKWTDEDVIRIVEKSRQTGLTAEYLMLSLQPQTEWEVEFVDGKLKLI